MKKQRKLFAAISGLSAALAGNAAAQEVLWGNPQLQQPAPAPQFPQPQLGQPYYQQPLIGQPAPPQGQAQFQGQPQVQYPPQPQAQLPSQPSVGAPQTGFDPRSTGQVIYFTPEQAAPPQGAYTAEQVPQDSAPFDPGLAAPGQPLAPTAPPARSFQVLPSEEFAAPEPQAPLPAPPLSSESQFGGEAPGEAGVGQGFAAPSAPLPAGPPLEASPVETAPQAQDFSGPLATRDEDAVRLFSQELTDLVALGRRYRAASPGFLDDLELLADKYATIELSPVAAPLVEPSVSAGVQPFPGGASELAEIEPGADALQDEQTQQSSDGQSDALASAELSGDAEQAQLPGAEAPSEEAAGTDAADAEPPVAEAAAETPDTEGSNVEIASVETPASADQQAPESELPPTRSAVVYLRDDFTDGDFTNGFGWTVRQGDWAVDPSFGLRQVPAASDAGSATITPDDLLKSFLDQGGDAPAIGSALIEAQTRIGNAFSLFATVTDHAKEGTAHFIMHQGGSNWLGYRLELRMGRRPVVVLTRRGSSGYKDIMKVEAPRLAQEGPHRLRWVRLADGQMFVLVDERPVIRARDTVFQDDWTGFGYFVANGDVSLRNIRVAEPVDG